MKTWIFISGAATSILKAMQSTGSLDFMILSTLWLLLHHMNKLSDRCYMFKCCTLRTDGWIGATSEHIRTGTWNCKLFNLWLTVCFSSPSPLLETIAARYGPQLTGKLPDREEDWTWPVQWGVPGEVPARQHVGRLEESSGEQEITRRNFSLVPFNCIVLGCGMLYNSISAYWTKSH